MDSDSVARWLFGDKIPVTKLLIVANVVTYIAVAFGARAFAPYVLFSSGLVRAFPWTLFTYPLIGASDIISLIFQGYWLWVAGGRLERGWGSRRFAGFFFIMSAVSAMGLYAGSILSGVNVALAGLWVPLAGVTVAFAALDPDQQILFFLIVPVKLKYLALIGAAALAVNYGSAHWLLSLFSLLGCLFSYWFVRSGMQYGVSMPRPNRATVPRRVPKRSLLSRLNFIAGLRDRRERRRLRELFERSFREDDRPPNE